MIRVRGLSDGGDGPPVFETRDLPDMAAELAEITVETPRGPLRHTVTGRNLVVTEDGGYRLDLDLLAHQPSTGRVVLAFLDRMPRPAAGALVGLSVTAFGFALIGAGWWLIEHRFETLGYLLRHAPTLLAALTFCLFAWIGLGRENTHVQRVLGGVGVVAAVAIYLLISSMLPHFADIRETLGFHDFDIDYQAFGELSWKKRDKALLLVAPWVPKLVILMNALGWKILPALLEKNVKG